MRSYQSFLEINVFCFRIRAVVRETGWLFYYCTLFHEDVDNLIELGVQNYEHFCRTPCIFGKMRDIHVLIFWDFSAIEMEIRWCEKSEWFQFVRPGLRGFVEGAGMFLWIARWRNWGKDFWKFVIRIYARRAKNNSAASAHRLRFHLMRKTPWVSLENVVGLRMLELVPIYLSDRQPGHPKLYKTTFLFTVQQKVDVTRTSFTEIISEAWLVTTL